ncbi:MAG: ABC transporter permease [Solirubrobacteraceae bacterium]
MHAIWEQLRAGISLIFNGNGVILNLTWVTIRVAVVSTTIALVIGLPIGVAIGIGRFRGRRALQIMANASLALPPVVVGVIALILMVPGSVFGSLRIEFTITAVYIVQAILALPYVVAFTPAAIQALPPGLLDQARALGAGRRQLALLALREARIGILASTIAAMGATVSEVGAVVIAGGNIQGQDQTLASGLLDNFLLTAGNPQLIAITIMLVLLLVLLLGSLTVLQQRSGGVQLRFRTMA